MSCNLDCIPSSALSSPHSIDCSPSHNARVMAVAPTTSRAVSFIKPFLLGFVVAVILLGVAALSSIHALCSDYIPLKINSSKRVYGDRFGANHRISIPNTKGEKDKAATTREAKGNKNRLEWRETLPFISFGVPKQREHPQRDQKNDEEGFLPSQLDSRSCLCHLILEPFRHFMEPEDSCIEDDTEKVNSQASRQHSQQQHRDSKKFRSAFTPEILDLSSQQERLVLKMRDYVLGKISYFEERASLVPWGGPSPAAAAVSFEWYARKKTDRSLNAPLDKIDGGNLFSSYLRIMKWPENLDETEFPFKLCKTKKKVEGKGCDTSVAMQHSLEFRERYRPWLVTPGIERANTNGLVYVRGFSPPYSKNEGGGHAIVWLHLALKVKTDDENDRIFFVRSMIREFDRAVAVSLQRSNGRVGKFNAVVDGKDFTWSSMPSLSAVKALVVVLQDHFADRLGVVILVNVGSICEILLKIFLPLITEEVRNKIVMLPHDQNERLEALEAVLGTQKNIPIHLGGTDDYSFNLGEYYTDGIFGHDEEALEYLTTMPYYAR